MVVLGLDGWGYLTTNDPTDLLLYEALTEKADELRQKERQLLALEIVNTLAKSLSKKKKS